MNPTALSIMVNNKEHCCGCAACEAVCPMNAIFMTLDEDGFYYPYVDNSKCIHCEKCRKVCAFQKVEASNVPHNGGLYD